MNDDDREKLEIAISDALAEALHAGNALNHPFVTQVESETYIRSQGILMGLQRARRVLFGGDDD